MDFVKEPHLDNLRKSVSELQRLVYGEPTDQSIVRTWNTLKGVKDALERHCPNYPSGHILR